MGISNASGVGLCWLGFVLVCIFVFLRLYVRWKFLHIFSASDGFIIVAWVFYTYLIVGDVVCERLGQWDHPMASVELIAAAREWFKDDTKVRAIMIVLWTAGGCYFATLYCVKAAFILFYYVLFPKSLPMLRAALHVTSIIVFVCFFVTEGLILFSCVPVQRTWAFDDTFCSPYILPYAYYFSITTHLVTDFLIYIMPFFLLSHLQLKGRQRIGVNAMFLLGFLNLCVGVVRVVVVGTAFQQSSVDALAAIEMCTAIMVACSPPLKWLICSRKSNSDIASNGYYYEDRQPRSSTTAAARRRQQEDNLLTDDMDVLEWGTYVGKPRQVVGGAFATTTRGGGGGGGRISGLVDADMEGILVTSTTEMTATAMKDKEALTTPVNPAHIRGGNGVAGQTFVTADGRYMYGWEIGKQSPSDNVRRISGASDEVSDVSHSREVHAQ